jgi:hypothetical protein
MAGPGGAWVAFLGLDAQPGDRIVVPGQRTRRLRQAAESAVRWPTPLCHP